MSEDSEPDQLAEMAKRHKALIRQIEQIDEMIRRSAPLRRQVEPIVQAAEQFALDTRIAMTGGPVPPFQRRVVRSADAIMHELLPAREPVVHDLTLAATVTGTASLPGVGTLTASGSAALAPMGVAGQFAVEDRPSRLAKLSDGQIVFLVLVWLYAFVLPWFGAALPPEFHQVLSDGYATFALALAITWRMLDKAK